MYDFEPVEFDFDGDGIVDATAMPLDLDGDGYEDGTAVALDSDGDGVTDLVNVDLDGDGYTDVTALDQEGDGIIDMVVADLDGDGIEDVAAMDTDHNGVMDNFAAEVDVDGDGIVDQLVRANDYDQDGVVDSAHVYGDTDGDGQFDTASQIVTEDGVTTATTRYDFDGDQQIDFMEEEVIADADGDGNADFYSVQVDTDGDQQYDGGEAYANNPETNSLELIAAEGLYDVEYEVPQMPNFDPEAADPEAVAGDPASSMENWEFQEATNRCTLYSQKFVIEELTGEEVDIEDFADTAEENGWFTEEGGATALNMNKMLDYHGIDNEMSFHGQIDDIEQCLNEGGKVIVSVDSGEIWEGESDNAFAPVDGADHAVQVIGIDRTDPENPMVILNDSGHPDGCGELVPLDVFEDAWADGDHQMILCH
ncbi:MAG: hypothetical protein IJD39_08295 [Clostridia bacterium]|nr:hypothetical protein [Clostridia bacterium]